MDQKPHTLWDRMVFEDGGRERERENSCCFEVFDTRDATAIYRSLWRVSCMSEKFS